MDFDSRFGDCITQCEQRITHTFANKLLPAEALNNAGPGASGYVADGAYRALAKNDRLAVYGDSVANTMLCREWYHENTSKAVWTLIRNEVLCNDFLAETGFLHGLDACINKDAGTRSVSNKMMATAVEAMLGAVHLDGGDAALRRVLTQLRIVNPYNVLVLFAQAAKFHLTGLGPKLRDAFDLSGRGVFDDKATSGRVPRSRAHSKGVALLARSAPAGVMKFMGELAQPRMVELRGLDDPRTSFGLIVLGIPESGISSTPFWETSNRRLVLSVMDRL